MRRNLRDERRIKSIYIRNLFSLTIKIVEHSEDPGVDGRIILRWILENGLGRGMDWIDLAQDMDRWRALVSAVMNLQVP